MMPKIITTTLFLFLVIPFASAQVVEGTVLNQHQKPLGYASVYILSKNLGTYTFDDGTFKLQDASIADGDTLVISYIGCETVQQMITLQKGRADLGNILVKYASTPLPSLTITPAQKLVTIGNGKREGFRPAGFMYGPKQSFSYQVGLFMPNDSHYVGRIESVSFFINRGGFKHKTPFRVRIYAVDEEGKPTQDLLLESCVVKAKKKGEWFTVNLSKYELDIPENGFLVAMEWLYRPERKYQQKVTVHRSENTEKKKEIWFGQSLGGIISDEESRTWSAKNHEWKKVTRTKMHASIQATLRVR